MVDKFIHREDESLPPGPRAFPTWEEYERYLGEEKDLWERYSGRALADRVLGNNELKHDTALSRHEPEASARNTLVLADASGSCPR